MLPCQCINCRFNRLGDLLMALELKGIRKKALEAAANIERLNAAYDKFNEAAPAHAADVEGLAPQIEALSEDLTFAAQTLGNSVNGSGESEKPREPPAAPPAVQQPERPKTEPVTPASPPAVGPAPTFPDFTEVNVIFTDPLPDLPSR